MKNEPVSGRNVYLDLGANEGDTIQDFLADHPTHAVWGFEANPVLVSQLERRFRDNRSVIIIGKAAWTRSDSRKMFLGHPLSGTIMLEKKKMPNAPMLEIDYRNEVLVKTVDFSNWLFRNFMYRDSVTVKMNIEGAEYPPLRRMLKSGTISLMDKFFCEFHQDRYPISAKYHDALIDDFRQKAEIIHWH